MEIPEFICSVVCAGLNMDEVASGENNIEEPEDFNDSDANLFKTEEEFHIDMGRKGKDKRLERPPTVSTTNFKQ